MPNRTRHRYLAAALALIALAACAGLLPSSDPTDEPVGACPPVEKSGDLPPNAKNDRATVPGQGQGAPISEIVRDQAVPGTVGVTAELPAGWRDEPEPAREHLVLCEYLLSTEPPSGAMCSYDVPGSGSVDLDLVGGRYRFLLLAPGTDEVRGRFELRGRPDSGETCPTTIGPTQRHDPIVYPPRREDLLAELGPFVNRTAGTITG